MQVFTEKVFNFFSIFEHQKKKKMVEEDSVSGGKEYHLRSQILFKNYFSNTMSTKSIKYY